MSRIFPQCLGASPSGRWVAADVLLRQEPDEDEDEEEDEGDSKEDDEDEDIDDGYSERACPYPSRGTELRIVPRIICNDLAKRTLHRF